MIRERDLDIGREPWGIRSDIDFDFHGGSLLEALGIPFHGGREAEFIEQRRMQHIRESANLFADLLAQRDALRQKAVRFGVQALAL